MKIIHVYEPDTGAFVGSTFADPDPLQEGSYILPAYSTDVEPPKQEEHVRAVWDGNKWELKADWRGVRFWDKATVAPCMVYHLGHAPNFDVMTDKEPPQCQQNQFPQWSEELNDWTIVADFRGQTVFNKETQDAMIIDSLGPVPDTHTLLVPPTDSEWDRYHWVPSAKLRKITEELLLKQQLQDTDVASVRAIREWLTAQPGCPQKLKEHENGAQDLRVKLRALAD